MKVCLPAPPSLRPIDVDRGVTWRDRLIFYPSIALFGVGALLTNVVCWLALLLPETPGRQRCGRRFVQAMLRLWRWYLHHAGAMKVFWPDQARLAGMKGCIVVANHPNLLDICWILGASADVVCMFKSAIRKNGFLNASACLTGCIRNDQGLDGLHEAVDKLQAGAILVMFPEGTRTQACPMNPFKQGFALVAKAAGAPVQTLYIHSRTESFSKGHFYLPSPMPIHFHLRFGERFTPDQDQPARVLAQQVEACMRSRIETGEAWN